MGAVKVLIDDTDLDNGTTRRIVGHPFILSDATGKMHEFQCEFLVTGSTAAAFNTLFDDSFNDLELINPRLRYWQDSSTTLPTFDWNVGDGKHTDLVSSVQVLADESRTQKKLHCLLRVVAMKQLDLSGSTPPATDTALEGLASKIEISKIYMDSERYTLSAAGAFKSTLNPSVEGPYNLASVSSSSGKARFTLQSPDVITEAYDAEAGQFIDVSSPSAYEGRHFIRGISGGGSIVDTTTAIASAEGDVNATILYGDTNSAEANFTGAKNLILTNLLETGANGSPNSNAPHMGKLNETIAYSSEKKDLLDFLLVSGPAPIRTTTADDDGDAAERGLMFSVKYLPPEIWNQGHAPMVWRVVITGKCAISQKARDDNDDLDSWFQLIKRSILLEVEPTVIGKLGGQFRERLTEYDIDYGTNDVSFIIIGDGNYGGTLSYSKSTTLNTQQLRTSWRNTDGTHAVQEPAGPTERTALVRITWLGESGSEPGTPQAPTESGFTYLYDSSTTVDEDELVDPEGVSFKTKTIDYVFNRYKLEGGGSSGGGSGATGGAFNGDGYYVPTSPDI